MQETPPKQTTALGDAVRAMTLNQWLMLIAAVMGVLMQVILRLSYAFQDVTYRDYMGFIRFNELHVLHYASLVCVLIPCVAGALKWLYNQAAESFCWD